MEVEDDLETAYLLQFSALAVLCCNQEKRKRNKRLREVSPIANEGLPSILAENMYAGFKTNIYSKQQTTNTTCNPTLPDVSAFNIPARRPLKSLKTSSTVRGLVDTEAPSIIIVSNKPFVP
jgi:hypothetical protein